MISRARFVLVLCFDLLIASSVSEGKSGVCVSHGGRFPPFSSEGKPPRKVPKGPRDLGVCRLFRKNTCCDVTQTYPALVSIRRLASVGEASKECLHLWELLECSICDPRVGVQPGLPLICESFCDMVLEACSAAYFSIDANTQVLSPCGLSDLICGRASYWAYNGTEFCQLAGFSVQPINLRNLATETPFCYGGKASLESVVDSWRSSGSQSMKTEKFGMLEDFWQWMSETPVRERVPWAVGGMVLTAGLIFLSKRKSYSYRQKRAAIIRTASRLEGRGNQDISSVQRTRKHASR